MFSIVIPVYNQHELTADCLAAIIDNTKDCEIIIVDNGSDPPIEGAVIRNETNLGFPVAVNQGIRAAMGDVIIVMNNDVIVTPAWTERILWHLQNFAIVGPLTNYCAGLQSVLIPTYQDEEELSLEAMKWSEAHDKESQEASFVIGFCMAFNKSLYDEIGQFDESLWPCSGEEIDFCLRARAAGHKVGIARDVYLHHEGSKTFEAMQKDKLIDYNEIVARNDKHLETKWGKDFWGRQLVIPGTVEGIRLNLGSGLFPLPGFTNIDQFDYVNPDICCDALSLPYEPGTVSEIYAGHILEHFTFTDGMKALRYWYSLLKSGGVIGISVPDYDFLVKKYIADPTPEKLMELNDVYIYSGIQPSPHQYAYSGELLKKVMTDAGFTHLERMAIDHPYYPYAVDWQVGFRGVKL